jgi:hypothetical protein
MDVLDIKHVQLDTMAGHFLLPALLAYPLPAKADPATAAGNGAGSAAGVCVMLTNPAYASSQTRLRTNLLALTQLQTCGSTFVHRRSKHTNAYWIHAQQELEQRVLKSSQAGKCLRRRVLFSVITGRMRGRRCSQHTQEAHTQRCTRGICKLHVLN